MNGQRVLDQVRRTQAALATPGFDLDAILRDVTDEVCALTGAETAILETPSGDLITSTQSRRLRRRPQSSLVILLRRTGDRGALRVSATRRLSFGREDVLALEVLAELVSAALKRAALPAPVRRPPAS